MPDQKQQQNSDAVYAAFLGAAPEKARELDELWKKHQFKFTLLEDNGPDGKFVMDAGAYREIRFNHRVFRALWVSAFAAWEGYSVVIEQRNDFSIFHELVDCVNKILCADDPCTIDLPDRVPEPGMFPDPKTDPLGRACAELAVFSAAWILLHEAKHIKHQQAGTAYQQDAKPEEKRKEELSCDAYATNFILESIKQYSEQSGDDRTQVEQKRQLGIFFTLFALVVFSYPDWDQSDTHPSPQKRINDVFDLVEAGIEDTTLSAPSVLIAASAFIALKQRWSEAPNVDPVYLQRVIENLWNSPE